MRRIFGFGQHLYVTDQPLVLVEGPIDMMRLFTLGIKNVVASCGEPSREQLASVHAPSIYVGYDADTAGRRFARKALQHIDATRRFLLDWEVAGIKDAG